MSNTGVLSDRDISREIHEFRRKQRVELWDDPKGLAIEPYDQANLQPASYDLTLGSEFVEHYDTGYSLQGVEIGQSDRIKDTFEADQYVVDPGEFLLGHTRETITLPPNITAEVKGRSSLGRLGLIPHTAGWIDPGFSGQITLEFVNHGHQPVVIDAGMRCAQIVFTYTNTASAKPYGEKQDSKYQGQTGVTESRIEEDAETPK